MKERILLFLKGLAMGAADVVPGVSGGTIAFITGIYEELLGSIKSVDIAAVKKLTKFQLKDFWSHINGNFLLVLFLGIGTALISLSRLVLYLLENHPEMLWSFFFGLIIASALLVGKQVKKWGAMPIIGLLLGTAVAYWVTTLGALGDQYSGMVYVFFCGAIAICAMILPGISGSFILILLGAYEYVFGTLQKLIDALATANMGEFFEHAKIIGAFMIGCVFGLLSFSRLLSWLFSKFHDFVVAILIGFLLGSLNKVWPWKETIQTYIDRHGVEKPLVQENISPMLYTEVTGKPDFMLESILLAIGGFVLVYGIEVISRQGAKKQEPTTV